MSWKWEKREGRAYTINNPPNIIPPVIFVYRWRKTREGCARSDKIEAFSRSLRTTNNKTKLTVSVPIIYLPATSTGQTFVGTRTTLQ